MQVAVKSIPTVAPWVVRGNRGLFSKRHGVPMKIKFGKQRRCLWFARVCLEPVLGKQHAGHRCRDLRRRVLSENKQIDIANFIAKYRHAQHLNIMIFSCCV